MPDFVGIKDYLNKALQFAATVELRDLANSRLNFIDMMLLIYKADVAAGKKTPAGWDTALALLDEAVGLTADQSQSDMVAQKIDAVSKLKSAAAVRLERQAQEAEAKKAAKQTAETAAKTKDAAKVAKPEPKAEKQAEPPKAEKAPATKGH